MPRGQQDYGVYQEQYAIGGMSDVGEGAARLDAINVYDRRGFTVWQDDFEAPVLRWRATTIGAAPIPALSTDKSVSGVQSVYLSAPATGRLTDQIYRKFPLIRLGRIGAEIWLQGYSKDDSYLGMVLSLYDGATPSQARWHYDTNSGTILIQHDVGGVVTDTVIASNVYMEENNRYFLPIKMVIDMDTDTYVRLMVGEREFDLTAFQLLPFPASADRYVGIAILAVSSATNPARMYADNFILTQNEP